MLLCNISSCGLSLHRYRGPPPSKAREALFRVIFDFVMLVSVNRGDLYCCFSNKNKRGEIHLALLLFQLLELCCFCNYN